MKGVFELDSKNDRLRRLRNALDLNQTEFGQLIDASQNYLSSMEKGHRDVTEKIVRIVCLQNWDGRKVNEAWLRTGEGGDENMFIKEVPNDEYMAYATLIGNGANDRIKEAIIKYGRLTPENKKIIDDALELLVQMLKKEE